MSRANLFLSKTRTLIFELRIFEVFHSSRRLRHSMNASERIGENDMFNSFQFNVSDEWIKIPVEKVAHALAIGSPYRILIRIGEEGSEFEVDKLFAMQGKIIAPIFLKSAYVVNDIVQPVRCTVEVS